MRRRRDQLTTTTDLRGGELGQHDHAGEDVRHRDRATSFDERQMVSIGIKRLHLVRILNAVRFPVDCGHVLT